MNDWIPERLRPGAIDPDIYARFLLLCDQLEDGGSSENDRVLDDLLAEWNSKASKKYELIEFKTYSGAVSKEEFVREALIPRPPWIDDLTFEEASRAVEAIMNAMLSESDSSYVLTLLEVNLPGCNISDLIYWPNEWFGQGDVESVELTSGQIVGYAMARSGRRLSESPDNLELPHPVPR